jgi:hypothetical protein
LAISLAQHDLKLIEEDGFFSLRLRAAPADAGSAGSDTVLAE